MAMKSEQRDKWPLCGARTKTGAPCRMFAGQGTDHAGVADTRCFRHGGTSPSGNKHAVVVEAQSQMAALVSEPLPENTRPTEVLLWLMREIGGNVRHQFSEPADLTTEIGRAKFRLTMEQVDRAARLAAQCSTANAEETEITVKEGELALLAETVKQAAREAGLTELQIKALAVGMRMARLEAASEDEAADQAGHELDQLKRRIKAADEQRIADRARVEAERLSGLTMPPEEMVFDAQVVEEPRPAPRPRRAADVPSPPAEPPPAPVRTNYQSDLPDDRDPLFKPF